MEVLVMKLLIMWNYQLTIEQIILLEVIWESINWLVLTHLQMQKNISLFVEIALQVLKMH